MNIEARALSFEKALRRAGVRITRQRAALLRVLAAAEDHPDATQLHARATEAGAAVSLATVYRTLAALEAQGVILKLEFAGEPARSPSDSGAQASRERLQRQIDALEPPARPPLRPASPPP